MFVKTLATLALLALSTLSDARPTTPGLRRRCQVRLGKGAASGALNVGAAPTPTSPASTHHHTAAPAPTSTSKPAPAGCFPSANFNAPDSPVGIDLDNWWCDRKSEYAFMGFSFAVDSCPSKNSMTSSFKQMKNSYGARYVRLYASCDRDGFFDDVVEAAYDAGLGVFALIWFGFNGDDSYKGRMSDLLKTIKSNKLAPYVIRNVALGSEAMYDNAISIGGLISTINSIKSQVSKYGIQVSTSDMPGQYSQHQNVIDAVDHLELNELPFFSGDATTGSAAGGGIKSDLNNMANQSNDKKKLYLTQTGWPSNDSVWKANSRSAVASTSSEKAYFDLLDNMCSTFKGFPQGGAGWFAHVWDDNGLPGWGITNGGHPKFDFNARSHC